MQFLLEESLGRLLDSLQFYVRREKKRDPGAKPNAGG